MLQDSNPKVRVAAIGVLEDAGDESRVPRLPPCVDIPPEVRAAAQEAIDSLD